jgi:hypothetical protein
MQSKATKDSWKLTPQDRTSFMSLALVGAAVFAGLALLTLWSFQNTLRMAFDSSAWPSVQGTIVQSSTRRSSNSSTRTADIRYTYHVDDRLYENGLINAHMVSAPIDDILATYPEGRQVAVFYDPADPTRALLEPGFRSETAWVGVTFLIVFETGFLGLMGAVLWVRWRVATAPFDGTRYVVFKRTMSTTQST